MAQSISSSNTVTTLSTLAILASLVVNSYGIIAYDWSDCQDAFDDISTSGTVISAGDDTTHEVAIGFPFNFYGIDYTSVFVLSNGAISFTNYGSGCCSGKPVPNPATPNNWIQMWQEDLDAGNVGSGPVTHLTKGTEPNREFIVQFTDIEFWVSSLNKNTFQAILYESSNTIQLRYGVVWQSHGTIIDTPAVGIENADGSDGISIDPDTISEGSCIEFALSRTRTMCHTMIMKKTIRIPLNAVETHLNHGDTLGACPADTAITENTVGVDDPVQNKQTQTESAAGELVERLDKSSDDSMQA